MRVLVIALLVLPLAGCTGGGGDGCPDLSGRAVVEAIGGNDASVRLPDGQPAVLHLPEEVFVRSDGVCTRTGSSGIVVGDTISFEVDAWAESYPMQGWPEEAVVLR